MFIMNSCCITFGILTTPYTNHNTAVITMHYTIVNTVVNTNILTAVKTVVMAVVLLGVLGAFVVKIVICYVFL